MRSFHSIYFWYEIIFNLHYHHPELIEKHFESSGVNIQLSLDDAVLKKIALSSLLSSIINIAIQHKSFFFTTVDESE